MCCHLIRCRREGVPRKRTAHSPITRPSFRGCTEPSKDWTPARTHPTDGATDRGPAVSETRPRWVSFDAVERGTEVAHMCRYGRVRWVASHPIQIRLCLVSDGCHVDEPGAGDFDEFTLGGDRGHIERTDPGTSRPGWSSTIRGSSRHRRLGAHICRGGDSSGEALVRPTRPVCAFHESAFVDRF